jgi:hypothetical protein
LKLRLFAVNPRPAILQFTPDWTQDAETLVYLSQQQKNRVRSNLGPWKSIMIAGLNSGRIVSFSPSPLPTI